MQPQVKEHEGDVNQEVLVLNKESVAPTETARGVLNFGFGTIHMKVYKGESNGASSSAGNPAEQVLLSSRRQGCWTMNKGVQAYA